MEKQKTETISDKEVSKMIDKELEREETTFRVEGVELTAEQEDFIVECGLERWREEREARADLMLKYDEVETDE